MSYLLDTNLCIYLFQGQFDLQRKINQVGIDSFYLSEITLAVIRIREILIGYLLHLQVVFCLLVHHYMNTLGRKLL